MDGVGASHQICGLESSSCVHACALAYATRWASSVAVPGKSVYTKCDSSSWGCSCGCDGGRGRFRDPGCCSCGAILDVLLWWERRLSKPLLQLDPQADRCEEASHASVWVVIDNGKLTTECLLCLYACLARQCAHTTPHHTTPSPKRLSVTASSASPNPQQASPAARTKVESDQ